MIMQPEYFTIGEKNWAATPNTTYKLTLIDYLPQWAKRFSLIRSRIFKSAQRCAHANFAIQHPAWVECLFDEHFLNHGAAALLAPVMQDGTFPQPVDLAIAWDKQVGPASEVVRQQRIAEITPAIVDFLTMLEAELATHVSVTTQTHPAYDQSTQAAEFVTRDA